MSINKLLIPKTKDEVFQSIIELDEHKKKEFFIDHIDDEILVDLILKTSENPNEYAKYAFLTTNYNIIEKFVENKVNLNNIINREGDNLLTNFCSNLAFCNTVEIFKLLIQINDINFANYNNDTPLLLAVSRNNIQLVKLLLDNGANPNVVNNEKISPLIRSCLNGNFIISKMLIECGADINFIYESMFSCTPLYLTVINSHTDITRLLIDNGANIYEKDEQNNNLLLSSLKFTNIEASKLFFDLGVDPYEKNSFGECAVDYGILEIIKTL